MKKITLAILCAAIAATSNAAAMSKKQTAYFKNRRICVERDTTTIPGYVITKWHRNGKPDGVYTNRLHAVVGVEQKNPIQELAERMRRRVERVTAALDEKRAEFVAKRDAAVLPSTKAIYQAFIDAIDRIKDKLDGED